MCRPLMGNEVIKMKYVEKILKYICILLFSMLVLIVSFQVISRALTGKSFTVVEELSMFLLAWCTFMCASYAVRKKAHVRVEYFVNRFLPPRGRDILDFLLTLGFLAAVCTMVWFSLGFVRRQMKVSMVVLPFSKGMMYLSFPVGMLFFILFLIDDLRQIVLRLRAHTEGQNGEVLK